MQTTWCQARPFFKNPWKWRVPKSWHIQADNVCFTALNGMPLAWHTWWNCWVSEILVAPGSEVCLTSRNANRCMSQYCMHACRQAVCMFSTCEYVSSLTTCTHNQLSCWMLNRIFEPPWIRTGSHVASRMRVWRRPCAHTLPVEVKLNCNFIMPVTLFLMRCIHTCVLNRFPWVPFNDKAATMGIHPVEFVLLILETNRKMPQIPGARISRISTLHFSSLGGSSEFCYLRRGILDLIEGSPEGQKSNFQDG